MLARCVATLKPPPELTLSQWADRYRMLSAESSAEPGRWHTDKAPYQREIMDAIGDAHIRRVVIMCAAQLGKTELLLNILGYFMAYKKVKKNKSASRAPAGESIEQRPEEIDGREEFGHWEGDTVYSGKGKRKTTRALLTLTERKTRKEIIIAIPNRKAETVVKALDALERKLGARRFRAIFKSITFDNGTEFAAAEGLERSCVNKRLPRTKVYFCHPYSSWERGTNENTNGMIRRRFPKGTNFAAVTNAQIAQAENWINNYPRKILGYKSSEIVFRECLRELGIAA